MELLDYIAQGRPIRFENLRPLQKILLIRNARDGHKRAYVGTVSQLRKPSSYVLDLKAEIFFEDSVLKNKFSAKEISFRNGSDIKVYLLQDTSVDSKARLAEARRAYAQARKSLQQARVRDTDYFSLLGITQEISLKDFTLVKKKIMLKWHPDRQPYSNLSPEEFMEQSKKYTDAISYVTNYLNTKQARIS